MRTCETPQSIVRCGVARCDITPPVGIYHRMWGAATHERAAGVHRPLLASALVLAPVNEQDQRRLVIITLDHCLLGESEIGLLQAYLQHGAHCFIDDVLITFTHTHGAGLMSLDRANLPGGELIEPYLREVADRCAKLALEAGSQLAEATITYGLGRCSLAANRDHFDAERNITVCGFNPGVPADDTVLVARVSDRQGTTVATLVNYACHPTTLAWENQLISPDYIGALRETVERETNGAPCIFLQGASAELGPREGYVGDVQVADRNGRQLAYAALEALTSLAPPRTSYIYQGPTISGATLGVWKHEPWSEARQGAATTFVRKTVTLELPYRKDRPSYQEVVAAHEEQLRIEQAALAAGDQAQARDARAMVERHTRMRRRMDELPAEKYPYAIQAWRFGDAIWLGVRGELYSALQTTLRARFPGVPIMVLTLVDGWGPSYVVPQETYGKGLYQESVAVLAPGTFEQVVAASGELIAQLLPHK
jgi:hypothetical protein